MTRVGVVGLGAVGRVYVDVLLRAPGVDQVTVLVRPSSVDRTPTHFTLRPLHKPGGRDGRLVGGYDVRALDDVDAPLDVVIVTVPSTAMREPGFVEGIAALPGSPVVLGLQPGLDDRARWLTHVEEERLVIGTLALCSWTAPLDDDDPIREGTVCWFPPLSRFALCGPRARPLAALLDAGGMPVRVKPGLERTIAIPSAAMVPIIAALELAGWTFRGLRTSGRLAATSRTVREAIRIAAAELGGRVPVWTHLVRAPALWALTRVAGWAAPFDLERFLHVHFDKVSAQTLQQLETWDHAGASHALPHDGLATMARSLREARHSDG